MAIPGYRILRKIRQGGMSTVYLAIQVSIDREVALKVMSPTLSSDPSFGSRFYREAKIVGQLSHPNIVSIYDVGSHKQYNYIAMDYLPGIPLQDRLDQGVSPSEALAVTREMASALDYAHSLGYIHRDIKPDNILFRGDGSSVLCDFGIAKALKGTVKMTNVGAVLGTPNYMSPEQAQGKELDGRADLYSLGVVLFEMLAGQVPFPGDEPVAVAVKHMSAPIPKLPSSVKSFQPLVNQLMAKKASTRFQTGKEVIDAVDALEQTLAQQSSNSHYTNAESTSVQVISLVRALASTLSSTLTLMVKRFMLREISFSRNPIQVSAEEQVDMDDFVFQDTDPNAKAVASTAITAISDRLHIPLNSNNRMPRRFIYGPLIVIATVLAGYLYMDPDTLRGLYAQVDGEQAVTPAPASAPVVVVPEPVAEPVVVIEEPVEELIPEPELEYALAITTVPPDAMIRIINIKPAYRDGMTLPAGAYHIEISAIDYYPQKQWVRITKRDLNRHFELEATRKLLPAGTPLVDKLADGSDGPQMIVLPQELVGVTTGNYELALPAPIAVSSHEITFAQYDAFAKMTQRAMPDDYGWGREQRPVVGVSYDDARAFASWLSEQTQQPYRLPNKQEWEYAARGGQSSNYSWGEQPVESKANCRRGCKSKWSKLFSSSTAPVGEFEPNNYQLFDTAGNVAEWLEGCKTWQDSAQSHCKSAGAAGGSHQDPIKGLQPGAVQIIDSEANKATGFRLVLDLPGLEPETELSSRTGQPK